MGKEIERKFLVKSDEYKKLAKGIFIRQGFLSTDKNRVVRIRIIADKAFLTIKGKNKGIERPEFEYEIPVQEATEMLEELCFTPIIEKYRYVINFQGFTWEVDEFKDANHGLVIAEIELENSNQMPPKPNWVGNEVSDDPRYFNSNLIANPYSEWDKQQ